MMSIGNLSNSMVERLREERLLKSHLCKECWREDIGDVKCLKERCHVEDYLNEFQPNSTVSTVVKHL